MMPLNTIFELHKIKLPNLRKTLYFQALHKVGGNPALFWDSKFCEKVSGVSLLSSSVVSALHSVAT